MKATKSGGSRDNTGRDIDTSNSLGDDSSTKEDSWNTDRIHASEGRATLLNLAQPVGREERQNKRGHDRKSHSF